MIQVVDWLERQAHPFLLYLSVFVLSFILVIRFYKWETNKYRFPPSPSKLPIIGNLHQLHSSPYHSFQSLAQKHGPIMMLHLGRVPTLVVSSVDIARDVLKTYDHVLSSRPQFEFPMRLFYAKDLVFAPHGEYWRQLRKVCVLQLLSAKKVQAFHTVREEEIALVMENIQESSFSTSVNLGEIFFSLTNNIVSRIALGKRYCDGEEGRKFKKLFKEFTYILSVNNIGDFIPSLAWVNYFNGLNARVEKNFREFDLFFEEVVEQHIEKKRRRAGDASGENEEEDFVDVLLRLEKDSALGSPLTRDSTKAIIMDMFGAGTETASITFEWAMSELLKNPEIMEEVQKEVRVVARGKLLLKETDTEDMHYLRAVFKETLRLHPPVPFLIPRESMENVKLQGYDIPAKTTILVNVYAIGRDPMLWEEPEKFWPKRFLIGSSALVDFKGQDFQFLPFGAGRRGCPGILFATSMFELALANLLNRFDWALENGMDGKDLDMAESDGITLRRKNDLVLTAKPHLLENN